MRAQAYEGSKRKIAEEVFFKMGHMDKVPVCLLFSRVLLLIEQQLKAFLCM